MLDVCLINLLDILHERYLCFKLKFLETAGCNQRACYQHYLSTSRPNKCTAFVSYFKEKYLFNRLQHHNIIAILQKQKYFSSVFESKGDSSNWVI